MKIGIVIISLKCLGGTFIQTPKMVHRLRESGSMQGERPQLSLQAHQSNQDRIAGQ